jgi:hypothetical protein
VRATRRRTRFSDPLASPSAVRSICDRLRAQLPELIHLSEKQLTRFLYAVRHVERRSATDTKRGRPGRWPRETLMKAASQLRLILERETGGRVSLSSFIGQYIPLLQFPSDVTDALTSGRINLQEAAQLARLTPERLNCSLSAARSARAELLQSHLALQGSQTRLRARAKEILGESNVSEVSGEGITAVLAKVDELLEIDPSDTRHLFWEEMKRFFFAMRDIEPEDLDEEVMDDFLQAMDQVSNVLHRLEKRRQKRKAQRAALMI